MNTTVPNLDLTKVDEQLRDLHLARDFAAEHLADIQFSSASISDDHILLVIPGSDDAGLLEQAARILAAGQPIGTVRKDISEWGISVKRRFGAASIKLWTTRSTVCEAKVVGTEKVMIRDPNAPMIEVERDIVEWDCKPILQSSERRLSPAGDQRERAVPCQSGCGQDTWNISAVCDACTDAPVDQAEEVQV